MTAQELLSMFQKKAGVSKRPTRRRAVQDRMDGIMGVIDHMRDRYISEVPEKALEEQRAEAIAKYHVLFNQPMPTPYQEPLSYCIISDLAAKIEATARQLSLEIPIRPVLGTVPTGHIYPWSKYLASSQQYLLVF